MVSFPNEMYRGKNKRVAKVIGQHRQFLPGSDDNDNDGAEKDINSILWEPVTGTYKTLLRGSIKLFPLTLIPQELQLQLRQRIFR